MNRKKKNKKNFKKCYLEDCYSSIHKPLLSNGTTYAGVPYPVSKNFLSFLLRDLN